MNLRGIKPLKCVFVAFQDGYHRKVTQGYEHYSYCVAGFREYSGQIWRELINFWVSKALKFVLSFSRWPPREVNQGHKRYLFLCFMVQGIFEQIWRGLMNARESKAMTCVFHLFEMAKTKTGSDRGSWN